MDGPNTKTVVMPEVKKRSRLKIKFGARQKLLLKRLLVVLVIVGALGYGIYWYFLQTSPIDFHFNAQTLVKGSQNYSKVSLKKISSAADLKQMLVPLSSQLATTSIDFSHKSAIVLIGRSNSDYNITIENIVSTRFDIRVTVNEGVCEPGTSGVTPAEILTIAKTSKRVDFFVHRHSADCNGLREETL